MSLHILGSGHDLCRHGHLRVWAERGLVHIEDSRDNSYEVLSVATCAERLQAHVDMLKNSREQMRRSGFMDHAEYDRLQTMVEQVTLVCRKAQEQGEPFDEAAVRDMHRRQPMSVLMPSAAAVM